MPPRKKAVEEPATMDNLEVDNIGTLFSASQDSIATHRKNINTLHAVFLRCASVTTPSDDGKSIRLTGEKAFGEAFRAAVVYPLGVKKGVEQADRVIKFVGGFVGFAVEFDSKAREKAVADGQVDEDDEDDGPASRLVSQLLGFLLKGFKAKNKIARFRCVQLVALMVNSLGEIDDDSYTHLKGALLERVRDKESTVRMQAVVALSKLQTADDEEESDDDDTEVEATRVADVLIDVLTHDPAAEVRRAALFNLIATPASIPALLLRTLDVDPINRRAAFTHVLCEIPCSALSMAQREEALGRGLRDREEGVKRAAKKLAGRWAEGVQAGMGEDGLALPEFIKLFDIYDGTVAEKVLAAIFETKPEFVECIEFDVLFYEKLTPDTAFIVRNYLSHLRTLEDPRLADIEPVVTTLAFLIQAAWGRLNQLGSSMVRDEDIEVAQEFVVGELVAIAVDVDYGDEIGRRKMFELMRELLSEPTLPPSLIPKCLDVLLKGTSERDFMRIVVEIVQTLRADSSLVTSDEEAGEATDMEEDGEVPRAKVGKKKRGASMGVARVEGRKELDLRCLLIVRALLERVMGALQENSMLHGLVHELIVPSVKTKDVEVRAEGLICLGLCGLLDKKLALTSFELLARQSQQTEGILQIKILQIVFDLLVLHGIDFGAEANFSAEAVLGFLLDTLAAEEPGVAATAVVGVAKLMLSGMVTDEDILSRLVLLYFASETADNQELRQCLSYFFPVYCYSNPVNQRRVSTVFLSTLMLLKGVYESEDKAAMVTPLQIGLQLIDWTDPQKAVSTNHVKPDDEIHFDLAMSMIRLLYEDEQKDERKLLCQLVPKLFIPEDMSDMKIKSILLLTASLKLNRPLADALSKNALVRFETSLTKVFGKRIAGLKVSEVEGSEEVKEVRVFIEGVLGDDEIRADDDEEEEGDDDEEETEEEEEEEEEEGGEEVVQEGIVEEEEQEDEDE